MGNVPTQDQGDKKKASAELESIREELAELPLINKDTPADEKKEIKAKASELSKKAAALRKKEIAESDYDDKEKKTLELYDKGVQVYAIAQQVYDFANSDTVGKVMLTIRKEHADDFDAVEDINSTKGYTGVGIAS